MNTLKVTTYTMPAASMGPDNPLPDLKTKMDIHASIEVDKETINAEESRYMGWGRVENLLPYTIRDDYDRDLKDRDFQAIVLENKHLRATFLPEVGGRLWSLFDKDADRELLYVNPVFQPCNLALRNAWISGGVEWNIGIIGHTPNTLDDIACEEVTLDDGTPVLRMYQYERIRHLLYRIEAFLTEESKELYIRVRIDNTTIEDTAVYWWSNMAVDENDNVRVFAPAEKAFRYSAGEKLVKIPIPEMPVKKEESPQGERECCDLSRTTTIPHSMDFFFDIPEDTRPFLAALDQNGYGMCQTSTHELRGRKLFVWGMGTGGRHWQEFLSNGDGAYLELQAGLARTQLEHLPMKGGESVSWMESYGPLQADANVINGADYHAAVSDVKNALDRERPAPVLQELHQRVQQELDVQKEGIVLHEAAGFAKVEQELAGDDFHSAGLSLKAMIIGEEEEPWHELAVKGELPCPEPAEEPRSYQISQAWKDALLSSVHKGGSDHWYGYFQLGVMYAAHKEYEEAKDAFQTSLFHQRNPWALYGLAVTEEQTGDLNKAVDLFTAAAQMKPIRALAAEALDAMAQAGQYERMKELLASLPAKLRDTARIKVYEIKALLNTGEYDHAEQILTNDFILPDVKEGETELSDLWFALMACRHRGSADPEDIAWAEENLTPPEQLDFRMNG